jgi:hypothetical protein
MFVGMGANGAGGYNLTDSLRFRESASAYLTRTPASAGNRTTWTWSAWVKRGNVAASSYYCLFGVDGVTPNNRTEITFSANAIFIYEEVTTATISLTTTGLFRDPSAWYHIVVAIDTTQATSTNRVKLYVNGEQITSFSSATYPSLNYNTFVNSTNTHVIGARRYAGGTVNKYFDGYLTEVNLVDGQALTPSDFGQTDGATGVWKPKKYTGTYGTNGFYLPFKPTTQAEGFNTVLYTGTGATQSITGVGFEPDLVWIKNRASTPSHRLFDSVRGTQHALFSNLVSTEATTETGLTAFDSDGFTLGSHGGANTNSNAHVAWCWDAGSSTVSNTDGDITANVRANPASGFSVVTYTGNGSASQTAGHGLGATPNVVITKGRTNAFGWGVQHSGLTGGNNYLALNTTAAQATDNTQGSITNATSTTFQVSGSAGASSWSNVNGINYVSYCFSEVAGYSKFGSYSGTGSAGNAITTGFRPAFILVKRTDVAGNDWILLDAARNASNPRNTYLLANQNYAEGDGGTALTYDFNDTGFTVNGTGAGNNASGGTYIYMAFADTRDYQWNFDASGNKNNWTPNNINSNASSETTYDLMSDVPTLTDEDTANFATLNPLSSRGVIPTNGNLTAPTFGVNHSTTGTIGVSSGKWYFEVKGNSPYWVAGVTTLSTIPYGLAPSQVGSQALAVYTAGYKYNNGVATAYGATYTTNDIMAIALDLDAGTITFYKNGVSQGVAFTGLSGTYFPVLGGLDGWACGDINFGQRPFAYTPPTGYKALNTYNVPDSSIEDGSDYFNTVLYTGDGVPIASGGQPITGVGFSPDFVWVKSRGQSTNHFQFDTIRGATNYLRSSTTDGEGTNPETLNSFDTDGFTVGNSTSFNTSPYEYVAWNWKAGGTAVSNTDGTITSQVSANPTAGFSVVTWTGVGGTSTIGHGLGVAPKFIITKIRNVADGWYCYHADIGNTKFIRLDTTGVSTTSTIFGNTSPTSTVFTFELGVYNAVAYCFAEVEGYSKFGSYTGNGSADGTFVYTGFKPAFVIAKRTDSTGGNWFIHDSTRDQYNSSNHQLQADNNLTEYNTSAVAIDLLSNGYKLRNSSGMNASGNTYIYMAFAENPFKNSLAR